VQSKRDKLNHGDDIDKEDNIDSKDYIDSMEQQLKKQIISIQFFCEILKKEGLRFG
jgi:hypothetical protein